MSLEFDSERTAVVISGIKFPISLENQRFSEKS